MAVEAKRGCGYRKVGGLYMVSGNLGMPCGRLPLELHVCPTCNAGIKQTRGFQWIKPGPLFANASPCDGRVARGTPCVACILSPERLAGLERAGLLWVGEKFYPTPMDFMNEARLLGVSRRIPAIPRGFKVGEDWVLFAHPKAIQRLPDTEEEEQELAEVNRANAQDGVPLVVTVTRKGVITMVRPTAFEKIVTESEAKDGEAMEALRKKGITPVAVPDDDKDHQGSVFDPAKAESQPELALEDES